MNFMFKKRFNPTDYVSLILFTSLAIILTLSISLGFENLHTIFWQIGSNICHQLPERSFIISGRQIFLCSRCSGAFIGVYVGLLTIIFSRKQFINSLKLPFILILILPMIIDGVTQYLGVRESSIFIRFVTGLLAGSAFFLCQFCVLSGVIKSSKKFEEFVSCSSLVVFSILLIIFSVLFGYLIPSFNDYFLCYYFLELMIMTSFLYNTIIFGILITLLIYFHIHVRHIRKQCAEKFLKSF